jgi:5'-deoxynucleotidase YfbR-like HD superfamily hydrolase
MRKTFALLHRLSTVNRFSRDHCTRRESTLEHIGFCALFAYIVAGRLAKVGIDIDYGTLFRRVSAHDIEEAVLGDIPRTTKYWNDDIRHAFGGAERQAMLKIEEALGIPIFNDWSTAKSADTEGAVLKLVDLAAVVFKVWSEVVLLRNMAFVCVAVEVQGFMKEFLKSQTSTELRLTIMELIELNEIAAQCRDELTLKDHPND